MNTRLSSLSRIRKLSEGSSDLSMRRIKHKISNSKLPGSNSKIAKISSSPYSGQNKISRTPSYALIQPIRTHSMKKSNSSVRVNSKEPKNSLYSEEASVISQNNNSQLESLKIQARLIRKKINSKEKSQENKSFQHDFSEIFDEVIEKDVFFSEILKKIKSNYESSIKKLKQENSQLSASLDQQSTEKNSYIRMLERISKENMDLGKEVQRLERICTDLQSNLDEIRNISLDGMPRNDEDWKALVYENSQYSVLCHNMKLDIRDYQFKEEQLIKLVDALKNRGYPVDQVYEEDVRTKLDTDSDSYKSLDTSKLNKIPNLELSKILKSSDSFAF